MATPPSNIAASPSPFRTTDAAFSWVDKSPTWSVLHLEIIVMQVMQKKTDTWIVTSSHGQPVGDFGTKDSAQRYAVKFAATMIEKTLTRLSELESTPDVPTNGFRPLSCHLIQLALDPSDADFTDRDGNVRPDAYEAKKQALIDDWRARLRQILAGLDR